MENLKIREFKLTLEKYINENELSVEVKRMVLKEIYGDVERKSNLEIAKEIEERDREEAGKGE